MERDNRRPVRVIDRLLLIDRSIVAIPVYPRTSAEIPEGQDELSAARAGLERLRRPGGAPSLDEADLMTKRLSRTARISQRFPHSGFWTLPVGWRGLFGAALWRSSGLGQESDSLWL